MDDDGWTDANFNNGDDNDMGGDDDFYADVDDPPMPSTAHQNVESQGGSTADPDSYEDLVRPLWGFHIAGLTFCQSLAQTLKLFRL